MDGNMSMSQNISKPTTEIQFLFLHLPDLVLETLLSFLDMECLLTLRLVCRRTKSWIESSSKLLSRLQVTIDSELVFNDIATSTSTSTLTSGSSSCDLEVVPFCNFKFSWNTIFTSRPPNLPSFLQKYSSHIRHFDFSKASALEDHHRARNDTIIEILLSCPNIESLRLYELSWLHISRRQDGLLRLKKNFHSLRHLQIKQLLCTEYHGIEYFGELLQQDTCPWLEILDPPIIVISSPEYLSFNYKLYFKNYIILPIMNYLLQKRKRLRKLYVQEYLFDGEPSLLFQLASICHDTGTILIPETFLPFSRSMFLELPRKDAKVLESLGSLSGINDLIMMGINDGNLKFQALNFLSVSFRSFFISDDVLDLYDIPEYATRCLREVEIEMTNDPPWDGRPYKLSRFMRKLCSSPRDKVQTLNLVEVSRANDTTMIRALDVVNGFPNLSKLQVTNWDAEKSEFLILWNGLQGGLQEIQLRFCQNFNDNGVIGDDKHDDNDKENHIPAMLKLKRLKILILSDVGEITDKSFIKVFRHMRLKKFFHYSSTGSRVTRHGYNALAKGVFRDSIREMMIQCSSEFRQMDAFCRFLRQFPRLKRPQFDELPPFPQHQGNDRGVPLFPFRFRNAITIPTGDGDDNISYNSSSEGSQYIKRSCCTLM